MDFARTEAKSQALAHDSTVCDWDAAFGDEQDSGGCASGITNSEPPRP
jgi:hypothetical protein